MPGKEFSSWRTVPDDGKWHEWGGRIVCRVGSHFCQISRSGDGWVVGFGSKVRTLQDAKQTALVSAIKKANEEARKLFSMRWYADAEGRAMEAEDAR